jgi:hypothetical protein
VAGWGGGGVGLEQSEEDSVNKKAGGGGVLWGL